MCASQMFAVGYLGLLQSTWRIVWGKWKNYFGISVSCSWNGICTMIYRTIGRQFPWPCLPLFCFVLPWHCATQLQSMLLRERSICDSVSFMLHKTKQEETMHYYLSCCLGYTQPYDCILIANVHFSLTPVSCISCVVNNFIVNELETQKRKPSE